MFHCLRKCKNSWNRQFSNKERHCRDAQSKRKTSICPIRNGTIVNFPIRNDKNPSENPWFLVRRCASHLSFFKPFVLMGVAPHFYFDDPKLSRRSRRSVHISIFLVRRIGLAQRPCVLKPLPSCEQRITVMHPSQKTTDPIGKYNPCKNETKN